VIRRLDYALAYRCRMGLLARLPVKPRVSRPLFSFSRRAGDPSYDPLVTMFILSRDSRFAVASCGLGRAGRLGFPVSRL
jgi:hypothetical protein